MEAPVAFAVGLLSSYTLYRMKDEGDLRTWERRLLRPAGLLVGTLLLVFAAYLFTSII